MKIVGDALYWLMNACAVGEAAASSGGGERQFDEVQNFKIKIKKRGAF